MYSTAHAENRAAKRHNGQYANLSEKSTDLDLLRMFQLLIVGRSVRLVLICVEGLRVCFVQASPWQCRIWRAVLLSWRHRLSGSLFIHAFQFGTWFEPGCFLDTFLKREEEARVNGTYKTRTQWLFSYSSSTRDGLRAFYCCCVPREKETGLKAGQRAPQYALWSDHDWRQSDVLFIS